MKLLLLASIVAMLAGCPSAPRAILTDHAQRETEYRFTAAKSDQAKLIEGRVPRDQIVTRYASGDRTAYVLEDHVTNAVPDVSFKALDKATLVVGIARVSDINGWGTDVNGEVHRSTVLELEFPKAQLPQAFTMLQHLETSPLEAIASVWPTRLAEIQTTSEVSLFERGYVVDVDAKLITGNPFDAATLVTLYRTCFVNGNGGSKRYTDYVSSPTPHPRARLHQQVVRAESLARRVPQLLAVARRPRVRQEIAVQRGGGADERRLLGDRHPATPVLLGGVVDG